MIKFRSIISLIYQPYYTAFNEFNESGKTKIMESIIGKALTNSYHKRLAYLEDKEIASLVDYAKKYKISHSNLEHLI
jgi:hypothetical protein